MREEGAGGGTGAIAERASRGEVRLAALAAPPLAATAIVTAFFLAFPWVDIWFTGLFYRVDGGFMLQHDPWLAAFREVGTVLVLAVMAGIAIAGIVKLARPLRPAPLGPRASLFLVSTLALGPGLLVNGILKSYWGRPRPRDVEAFGGDLPFTEVWRMTEHCASNCSFVAGEGASAAWLLGLCVVAPRKWRLPLAVVLLPVAIGLSILRVAFGGHFLSDVLLAWCLVFLLMAIAWWLIYATRFGQAFDDATEAFMTRLGVALRGLVGQGSR